MEDRKELSRKNIIIAEFMGAKIISPKIAFSYVQYPESVNTSTLGQHKETYKQKIHSACLEYDSQWNWIMPVLHVIMNLPNEVCNDYFWSQNDSDQKNDIRIFLVKDIKELHNQVVEFIEWYNSKSNKS